MMTLRSVALLIKVKKRRIDQAEQAWKTQSQVVRQHEQAVTEALAAVQQAEAEAGSCRERIVALCSGAAGFRADEVVTLQQLLEEQMQRARKAGQALASARKYLVAERQKLDALRIELQRLSRQGEQFEDHRSRLVRQAEQSTEDAQDEESEEAAVARGVAARIRAAREPAAG